MPVIQQGLKSLHMKSYLDSLPKAGPGPPEAPSHPEAIYARLPLRSPEGSWGSGSIWEATWAPAGEHLAPRGTNGFSRELTGHQGTPELPGSPCAQAPGRALLDTQAPISSSPVVESMPQGTDSDFEGRT